ncbi:bifunctional 2-polyprenyl-6-hydroxyphenol methylase/3-demethylubiquinol 3-O-methyltransferase UbiG [Methylomonas sp. 2BW1-5-20]|uniref:bifunctional 2-polyprenyl-6-hydroxyphenol methylase/3-demethylubiquinol 3-O-methyltransferase UbiG n=1 Tax=Methylomonas sp. 2BW1-5-20 TaxID=3376686 RepID=UPI00404F69DB
MGCGFKRRLVGYCRFAWPGNRRECQLPENQRRTARRRTACGFDHVTCMEMLEHVPDPASIIAACATLVKPGGMVFFSTLNRVPKAWLLAIVAAEHVLKMVPKGTHDYKTFIKPSELGQMARNVGLELQGIVGIEYSPFSKRFSLGKDIGVNYIAAFQRPE